MTSPTTYSTTATFDVALEERGLAPLRRGATTTLQINVGKLCNQACQHCHVEAGPKRTERMSAEVAQRVLWLLERSPGITTVDLTGGAPELNANFRPLVSAARAMGRTVLDRCNLTVFFEPGEEDLPEFLASHQVEVIASLPCYTAANVDQQRGRGVFEKSIRALMYLNGLGYGREGSGLNLHLVYNPLGPSLPPPQSGLESAYREHLRAEFGIGFNHLFTITNMPIRRFAAMLHQTGRYESYMALLVEHFNPATVEALMCRSLISVAWDGRLFDCDFNQMLEIGMPAVPDIWHLESFDSVAGQRIATGSHCFGCTAGAGSSCGGALQ